MAKSFTEALKQRKKAQEKIMGGDIEEGMKENREAQKTFNKMNKKKKEEKKNGNG